MNENILHGDIIIQTIKTNQPQCTFIQNSSQPTPQNHDHPNTQNLKNPEMESHKIPAVMSSESVATSQKGVVISETPTVMSAEDVVMSSECVVSLGALTNQITCGLCRGYLIDAQTVTDCLHSCKGFFLSCQLF